MDERLNYTLSLRVWPPMTARPETLEQKQTRDTQQQTSGGHSQPFPEIGCGWGPDDTAGAVFSLPVKKLIGLSQPPEPFAGGAAGESGSTEASSAHSLHPDGKYCTVDHSMRKLMMKKWQRAAMWGIDPCVTRALVYARR
jgi:hypothetical protein